MKDKISQKVKEIEKEIGDLQFSIDKKQVFIKQSQAKMNEYTDQVSYFQNLAEMEKETIVQTNEQLKTDFDTMLQLKAKLEMLSEEFSDLFE